MNFREQRGFCRFFVPHYDEVVLFTMSFTCIVLLVSGILSLNYQEIEFVPPHDYDPRLIIAGLVFIAGLSLSLYHAIVVRPATGLQKSFMLFFAVIVNAFSGFMSGAYELTGTSGWLVVFPIFNMINSFLLLMMWRAGVFDESSISDRHAQRNQVVLAAAIVLILYYLCHVVYNLIWIQTCSICLFYSTNLIKVIESWFFRLLPVRNTA